MQIENQLRILLSSLSKLDETGRADLMNMAAIETNGLFKHPQPDNNWDTQQFEIKAHGIFAEGTTEVLAIRNWCLAAERIADAADALQDAERLLHHRYQVKTHKMRAACDLIIKDGRNRDNCTKARGMLRVLDAAA